MAAAALLALPFCQACAGGGEVNGLPCRECGESGRLRPARRRWRLRRPSLGPLADVAGWSVGTVLSLAGLLPLVPGVGGAVMVSLGAGEVAGRVFGHGLALWVGLAVGGVFALVLDRRIP